MQHPNTGPHPHPRLRPSRAPSSPAPGGAEGLPSARIIRIRIPELPDSSAGRIAPRQQLAYHVDRCIRLLDALEAPIADMEPDHEGWTAGKGGSL